MGVGPQQKLVNKTNNRKIACQITTKLLQFFCLFSTATCLCQQSRQATDNMVYGIWQLATSIASADSDYIIQRFLIAAKPPYDRNGCAWHGIYGFALAL